MSVRSPFELFSRLPALSKILETPETSPRQFVIHGLLGAARSLAAGTVALNAKSASTSSVVLVAVDGPETALDVIADLRAFVSVDEISHEKKNAKPAPAKSKREKDIARLAREETWANEQLPAQDSLPDDLKKALRLETALFPAWDVLPTESDRPEGMTLAGRRRVTDRLREIREVAAAPPHALVLVAPMTALMQPCESPVDTQKTIVLRTNAEHDPIKLARQLSDAGYDRVGQVEVRGEFSLRGGILDIFPYTSEVPFRVDFFGETIESIKPFDPISQRSDEPIDFIAFADASPDGLRKLFSPGASSGPYSLFDHLPAGSRIVFHEPRRLRQRAELYEASLISGRSICFSLSDLLAAMKAKFSSAQLVSGIESRENVQASEQPETFPQLEPNEQIDVACTTLQRLEGEISQHADAWKKLAAERQQTLVFCETGGHRHRLQTLFDSSNVTPAPALQLVLGKLSGGFDLRAASLAAITDREILGTSKHVADAASPKRKQPAGTVAVHRLVDLQIGDYVVHAAHGIGRYLGLARLEKSGRTEDYLTLLFANDVKLYVPAAHIGLVSKYIGGHADIQLSTLGGKVWARKKERAAAAIRDIAEDLLAVQAARKNLPGIVYPPDNDWQEPFEAAFPYEETPDQDSAIASVKKDMERTCPMDRLICGDVGFGKTEVALRASFKAVCAGKQVAVLVPTTLLAEQHGRTFKERFAAYPFTVEVLSRFKTAGQQKRILEKLNLGRVDLVVGTHRLIQKDVRFKDLGLAIIDEEQRFGVEHKEFFKKLRKTVDVLTMTATPIPRTMHMAMIGLRDISNLTTPPRNRRSVLTKVARVSDDLLRRAILREISRGGQVFIVHPRVHDIGVFKDSIAKLVPEARFGIGHGQMDGDELEEIMAAFLHGQIDVLVSTTIVESGLDIPSANTIIIHEADRFGLAELHQLRGRVGRSDIQAYCYLLLPEKSGLSPEGLRRLRALEEFDDLGAGFQLALKDLEIRGTGNVLGREQSGEIAEIGYELYCKLLDSTVRSLRGDPVKERIDVTLQLRGAAYIPEEFVQDDKAVLEIYRRLDDSNNDAEVDLLKAEVLDRFGPPPLPAERMFEETKLRRLAQTANIPYAGIDNEEGRLVLKLHNWDLKDADRALRSVPETKGVRIIDDETLSFGLSLKAKHDEKALRLLVRNILEPLAEWRRAPKEKAAPKYQRAYHG